MGSTDRASRCWWAPATTAATHCSRGRGWPGVAPRSPPCCWTGRPTTRAWPRWRRRVGGSSAPTTTQGDDLVASADLVVDGIVGIGGRGGLRPRAAELADVAVSGERPGGRGRPAERGRRRHRGGRRGCGLGRRHRDVRDTQARAARDARRAADRTAGGRRHRSGALPDEPGGRRGARPRRRRARGAAAAPLRPQVHPGRGRGRGRFGGATPVPPCSRWRGSAARQSRAGPLLPAPSPHEVVRAWPSAGGHGAAPADAGRVQAWVVGPGIGSTPRARSGARRRARRSRCRWSSTPTP